MRWILTAVLTAGTGVLFATQAPTPYKLGMFQRGDTEFIGVVIGDRVIDLAAANTAVAGGGQTAIPANMKQLIARYESGVRARIVEIVRAVTAQSAKPPAYVYSLTAVKTLPPIMYPTVMLNAAVNYRAHGAEMQRADASPPCRTRRGRRLAPRRQERRRSPESGSAAPDDTRWNPYMFLKSPTAIIADGEAVRLPRGRQRVDWECELGVVIGAGASYVPVAQAGGRDLRLHDAARRVGSRGTRRRALWIRLADREEPRHVRVRSARSSRRRSSCAIRRTCASRSR